MPEEKRYFVSWEIDIWAETPEEAAKQAAEIVSDAAFDSKKKTQEN